MPSLGPGIHGKRVTGTKMNKGLNMAWGGRQVELETHRLAQA